MLTVTLALALAAAPHYDKDHAVVTPDDIKWVDAPPSLPPGAKVVILEGDPSKEGFFTMRIRMPNGYQVPPHSHSRQERVTVISGNLNLGTGDAFNANATKVLPAGTYSSMPPGMNHFAWMSGDTVLQLTTMGPWTITYVNPNDDPRNKKQ